MIKFEKKVRNNTHSHHAKTTMTCYRLSESKIEEFAKHTEFTAESIKNELISDIKNFGWDCWYGNFPKMDRMSVLEDLNSIMDMVVILIPSVQEKLTSMNLFERKNNGFSDEFILVVTENLELLTTEDYKQFVRRFFAEITAYREYDEYNGQFYIDYVIEMAHIISKDELQKFNFEC